MVELVFSWFNPWVLTLEQHKEQKRILQVRAWGKWVWFRWPATMLASYTHSLQRVRADELAHTRTPKNKLIWHFISPLMRHASLLACAASLHKSWSRGPFFSSDASHRQHIGWYLKVVPDAWSNLELKSEKWNPLLWHSPSGPMKTRPFFRDDCSHQQSLKPDWQPFGFGKGQRKSFLSKWGKTQNRT